MPNPLDTLYDQLKGQYPDLVDRSEFIGKLSNDDELKKLHDAASKDIPGFVDFDNFKSKVGESLSTYDQDSDYKTQSTPAEQESAPTDITIPRREKGRHVPSEPQNGGISSEAYVPTQPVQPTDTHVDAEPFDRETGNLDELDRRYQEKVKRLEGYGREPNLYANEDEARKHYESYSKLYDEAEQDRLVYNRRVKAAEDERAEQQRQLDLQSKDRKTRRSAEYGGYTNDQVRKEQERLKKERAYLEDPKSRRNADYSKRVMEYNADQTALSGEADKRNKRAESKRAMYDEVRKVAEDPDVQKRITGNDTVTYVLSGNNTYALQNYDTARERAKTMSDEELVEHCKSIAGQKYARGDNKDIYAPLAAAFMAYHNELMYRLGGDEPKSALEMRYDMIDKATESSPEGDNFMLTLRNYLDGTAGMGTANFENDQSERANIPQFAVVDNYNALVAQKEDENMTKVEQIARYPQQEGVTDENMAAAANDISYDKLLEQAFERFGNENLKAYITAYALRNGISIDEAARRVNQSIWDETIGKTLEGYRPKSGFEFFVRRIFSDNMFAKLGQLGLRARNGTLGTTDPFAMSSMALDEYAKDHPILETGAAVFNFAVMEGPIFSGYGKVASGLVGAGERAIIGAATKTADKMAIDATARALGQSLMYRLAKGGATGALTGFQYGTMSGAIDQAYYDGNVDFGKVIANGGHMARDFAIMHGVGELFGVTGDSILRRGQRNLRNGQGVLRNRFETTSLHFLNNVAKTTTNASIVTGLYAAIDKPALERENKKIEAENKKIEAENARLPEDKQKPLKPLNQIASVEDTFYSSLRMFAGLDAVGMLRSAWSIGVRGQYERNKHVKVHFDKFDREALEKAFGKNPNSLLRQIVFGNVDGVPAKWFEIDPEAEAEIYKELGRELTPAEKEAYATYGFTELRKVILNKEIPWATRAKIVSVVTGRIVQEPPVARGTIEFVMDKSGTVAKRIIVRSLDMEGNVIQAREFDGQLEFEAARSLYESLNDRGWRNNALLCGNLVIDAIEDKTYADTVDEMAREKGIAPEQFEQMVFGIKQKDITGEKVTYQERQLVDEFDKRHQQKQQAETELSGPNKLFEQVAREVFGAEWKRALNIPRKSWGEMSEAEKEFVNRYIDRIGAMGVAERNKLMNSNPDWARAAKEYEESVRRRMAEAERPAEAEPLPNLEDEKVSVEVPAEERVEPVPEVIELEEEPGKEQPTQSAGPQDTPAPVEERPAEPAAEEKPATVEPKQPMTEENPQQAGTIGFEPVEQPTERERYDAERKAKAATITDADIDANREALGIPEGTALTDEARQIYAEDLAEDLMRYERFKRGESDEKARFHDYWESKFNPERPKLEKPAEKQEEPVEEEELEEEEVTDADALIEQFDNLKGRSDLEKYRNALKVFAGDDEIMGILEDLEPHDITEWVSSFLGLDSRNGYNMLWESKTRGGTVIAKGFKEETGWSWNDVKGFAFMFDNKNGMSPRRVAEKIWEALPSGMKNQYSDVDVFNIMMDLFKSSSRKSDLTNYIRNNRMEQVRELLNRRRSDELADIARYKERMSRGEEEPAFELVTTDDSDNEFAVREDEVAPFSLLSLNYRDGEVESGTVRSRARTRKQIGTIAKALGYKIRWVADKPYNAKIDTDEKVLYLNIRTDQPLAAVMGHEVTHDLRKSDPKAYEALKRYAQDLLGQEQWDSEVKDVTDVYNEEYKRRGWEPIRADKAEEEVVCDTMGKVLHSRKGLRELAGRLDPGVAGKVYRLMKGITDKVKSALGNEHDYSLMDSALQEFLESVEQRAKKGSIATIQNTPAEGEATIDLSLRRKPAPKKVRKVYKLMRLKMSEDGKTLGEDGKVYPLYIDSGTGLDMKNWYDADSPAFDKLRELDKGYWLYDLATGEAEKADKPSKEQIAEADAQGKRYMVIRDVYDDVYDKYNKDKENWEASQRGEKKWKKKKPFTPLTPEQLEKKAVKAQKDAEKRYSDTRRYYNIGLNGSGDVGEYALRPGWHAGSHPTMRQIGKGKNKNLRDDTFVWVEGYVPDDVEYQTEAEGNIDKDIPTHIPTDGHYLMLTNPNAKAAQADRVGWYVAGAFRPERILSDWEARQVIDEWNAEHPNDKIEYDFERESGRVFNAETMQLEEPGSEGAKQGIHRDTSGGYSVTDKADIESLAPRMDGESEAAYSERIGEIEADEKAFVDGDGQFSLKREDTMRDNSVKYFEEYHVRGNKDRKYGPLRRNSITRQALDKANEMIAEMRDYIAPWYDREAGGNRYLPEEVYGLSTIFDNASYGATLENTLICTRTLAYNDFCDSVKRKLGRPLTKRESFLASQMLYDIATDPQCLYCYVSLDRKAYDEYLLRYFDERDAVIERYNKMGDKSAENIDALYKTFLDGRKDTYQMRSRFNSWLMLADHDSAIGRNKVALSSDRKNALAQESDEEAAVRWRDITKQYNRLRGEEKKRFKQSKQYLDALHAYLATEQGQIKDACAYAQGASWAKKEAEYRSYTGELLRTTKRMLGGLASHYGLRFYSFSEYSPAFILENMQMVRDAALRGLKGFAYTKEIDFCKIFLPTGININCSTYGRRNAAGEIVMDERQGANWDEARALRDQYENMGIVFVATDDEMVRWAKEQPWIDVIIPFHIVRTGADIAEFYGWTNYTNVSADYDAQGRHKDIMPPEHNNSIEDYDRLIAERGLTRRFPQFYDGPGDQNYMKLINETRRKASDTPILTPVFNMEEAKKSFDKFVEKGGYWGGFYEVGADDVVRAVDEVAADIEAGKSAGEVEYGRQDIDFDSAMANLEKTRRRINRNREHGNTPKMSFSLKREDSQKVFDTAKRKFGETKDIREAGYVLPDGSMLDFSGRHELDPGTDSSFLAGRRTTDHRAINQISFVYDENGDEVDTGVSSDMPDFIKRGAIRIDNNAGSINLSAAPTMAQRKVLRELIRRNGGDVQVDFGDGWNSDHYVEYEEASAQRVLGDIDRYFDEGIKPEGNMRFSLKRETRTDADGNEVYTETREDGTKDREITTYGDGSQKALWYDEKGNLKERLDYYPDGEVSQVVNYDNSGNMTRHIQYDENRHITSYWLPAIGTDWKLDENGVIRGKSNGVEIKPYNFQFSLKREDAEYQKAAESKYMWRSAARMLKKAAKAAMPDTKIVDENGDPLVVWHGSDTEFFVFDRDKIGTHSDEGYTGKGFYFAPRFEHADHYNRAKDGVTRKFYLNVTNPLIVTGQNANDSLIFGCDTLEEAKKKIWKYRAFFDGREAGAQKYIDELTQEKLDEINSHDGVWRQGTMDNGYYDEIVVKDSKQVKSADVALYDDNGNFIPLSERFNLENEDVRYSLKRRRNRDDYTDEDRADAAIIANTYLAQADALRQQIEADRQREHQLVEERNKLLAFDYPAADPADRPAIMDRINALRNQINDLRNANYENNTKLRSMDYEYRVAKEILEQGAVTDEEAARFDAGQMTREEKVLESLFKAAADSRADKKAKQKAIRGLVRELAAITDNFKAAMKARGIESQRKRYDKGTVDHIIRLAKAMMGTGYIDNMTSYEVKRLMGMINNAATRESIETQAGRIVDMMLDHQIRTLRNDFDKQLRVTGQKTNSSGVQVQAGLDQEGQVVMEAMRKSMQIIADSAGERYDSNGNITEWGEFYEKTLNDMGDADPVKSEQARKIFEGVWLASKWYEDVRTMEINGRILRSQMEDFKASNKPAKDADKDTKQRYNDVLADYQEMLRQNKINIIEAYERMTGDVGMTQAESVRRAKEFADAQKQRVNEIQHNANSDLADVDDNTQVETPESRVFGANKNNVLARLLFASAGTYEKFMRFFGRMAPNGEGYLFKRFMTQYHHARQDYWKGRHSAFEEMDKKMAEVFGKKKMHWSDIYEMTRDHKKFPPITVSYWDGYRNGQPRLRMDELNQSEALYLYMINKMPDGRMKLRHMGITDDVVQQMAGQIDGRLIQLADWLQSEFLPKMRVKYNETHKRVFGADMAAIEDYFPLRVNKLSVASDMDITERDMNDNKPSTITGAIVKRRVNTLPIDLHTDAFDVALSHIDEMEHWSAYAEFNRDNNTLVNYKRFRTKVNNMRSLELGAGDVLWKNFTDAVAIAADAYHPRAGSRSGDHYATRVAKFVSTAKIALRPYTALKQLLSIPAFWADSDPLEQFKATVNVADTWQWAIENLPGFAERWQSRQAGNIKLANYNDLSGLRRRKTMRKLQRAGMWANAAIDGLACAMGGKAVYETKLKRYRKMGYDEARAQEKALIDAAISYNNSQQSSEGAYVSPLQVDRTWFANAFSVFRSASMGYTRRFNTSLRQLRNATFKPGYGAQSVEFLKKQMMRDGLTEEQAEKWAHRIYRRANLKAAASVAIFGQILPFTWNLGANMFYLLFGDDDKEKLDILADSFRHSFFGPVEGLTGGNVISELGDIAADTAIGNIWGDSVWGDSEAYKTLGYREFSTMPLSSDLSSLLKYFARDEVKAANEVVNILFQVATGVNPQTITDWATAILDFSRSDMERRDIAMFAMRLLSTPQSQLDKFYLDQMNISQEQADKMSVDDLIKRYATYKRWRETPLTGWMYSDEREKKVEEKFQKRYEEMLEERSVAEDGLRGAINDIKDLPRKRTMMQKLQKELTDSIEAADPDLYKKALEGEKADDDEYVRHVTDKDVEQMAELQMKKKALRAARDRKVQADKDAEAGRITQEEYDAIYKECAHQWKLYNYLNNTLPKKLKEWKLKMEPDMQDKYTPEQVMDTIRSKTDKALQMRPEDMKLKKGDKKKVKKNKKK